MYSPGSPDLSVLLSHSHASVSIGDITCQRIVKSLSKALDQNFSPLTEYTYIHMHTRAFTLTRMHLHIYILALNPALLGHFVYQLL